MTISKRTSKTRQCSATDSRANVSTVLAPTAILLTLIIVGCSDKPDVELPTTYQVTGKVVTATGQPMTGGMIEFRSTSDETLSATGDIQEDGAFSLTTSAMGQRIPGAVAGEHRVTVYPQMSADQSEVPVTQQQTVTVEPKENDLTITLDPPRS